MCIFIFVCTSVRLQPPDESPIAVSSSSSSSSSSSRTTVNAELQRTWRKAVMANFKVLSQFWARREGTEKNTKILLPQGRGSNRNLPEYEVTTKLQPLVIRINRIFLPRSWCSESRSLRDRHSPRQIKKMYPVLLLPGRVDTREDILYQNTCASAIILEF